MTETLEVTTLLPAAGQTAADFVRANEMASSPVHATIDHSTFNWKLTTVLHRITDSKDASSAPSRP